MLPDAQGGGTLLLPMLLLLLAILPLIVDLIQTSLVEGIALPSVELVSAITRLAILTIDIGIDTGTSTVGTPRAMPIRTVVSIVVGQVRTDLLNDVRTSTWGGLVPLLLPFLAVQGGVGGGGRAGSHGLPLPGLGRLGGGRAVGVGADGAAAGQARCSTCCCGRAIRRMNRNGIWRSVHLVLLATSTSVSTAAAVAAVAAVATIGFGRRRFLLDRRNVERAEIGLVQAARQVGRLVDARALTTGGGNLRRRRLDGAAMVVWAGMDVDCVVFLCNIGIVKVGLERMVGVVLHVRFLHLPSLQLRLLLLLLLLMRPNLFLRPTHGPADGQPTG